MMGAIRRHVLSHVARGTGVKEQIFRAAADVTFHLRDGQRGQAVQPAHVLDAGGDGGGTGGGRMPSRFAVLLGALLAFVAVVPARANTSNSLMDVSPDGSRLLVANSDNGTVTVIDTAKRAKLHEIKVGDKPEGVTWIGNGPL